MTPVIQELRTLRATSQDLESDYNSQKKKYDLVMLGLESEVKGLTLEVSSLQNEISSLQSKQFGLVTQIGLSELATEKGRNFGDLIESFERGLGTPRILVSY